MVAGWEAGGRAGSKVIRDWHLQNSHGDMKYSTGLTASNVAITVCGVGSPTGESRRKLS